MVKLKMMAISSLASVVIASAAIATDEMAPKNCNCDNFWISWVWGAGGIPRTCASLAIAQMSSQGKCMVEMDGEDTSCPTTYKCNVGNPTVVPLPPASCVFTARTKDANGNCTGETVVWVYQTENCQISSPMEDPDSGCLTVG